MIAYNFSIDLKMNKNPKQNLFEENVENKRLGLH